VVLRCDAMSSHVFCCGVLCCVVSSCGVCVVVWGVLVLIYRYDCVFISRSLTLCCVKKCTVRVRARLGLGFEVREVATQRSFHIHIFQWGNSLVVKPNKRMVPFDKKILFLSKGKGKKLRHLFNTNAHI
jgi:hypothetical protein